MEREKITKRKDTLAIVLATMAGMLMVSTAMFISVAQMGAINNNQIGLEEAKFLAEHNISLREYGELNSLVPINNKITQIYGWIGVISFGFSILIGAVAIILANSRNN